jgi:hypothetical protein
MKKEYIYMNVIAPSFILLPVIIAFVRRRFLSRAGKVLLFYLGLDAVVSLISSVLANYSIPNLPLYHIATLFETVILLYFFRVIFDNKHFREYINLLLVIVPALQILNTLLIQQINEFNSYALSLQSLLIIVLCFFYWWHYETDTSESWASVPLHWIISGIMLYFSSSFIVFTFSNLASVTLSKKALILLWNLHASLSIIMYVQMAIGIRKYH